MQCFCDGSARHNFTVGREAPPFASSGNDVGPAWWQPQCRMSYYEYYDRETHSYGGCLVGRPLRTVRAWDFASVSAMACDACTADSRCSGWRTVDNVTATLYTGRLRQSDERCIGGEKWVSPWGSSWGSAGDLGGFWFSTPQQGMCADGAPLGTGGCTWRVVEATYRNASCVDKRVDAAIEDYGSRCFETCAKPLNRTGDCYLACYKNALLGDASYNLSAVPHAQLISHWEAGFEEGGCPAVTPAPCRGEQCGP
mmetsp:Transcript_19042/g.56824  ORF Transcript_19042/g.56824 Transcript_19042/m.56824 type:complete len:254 (+) Transcript_19042:686-1447(+)